LDFDDVTPEDIIGPGVRERDWSQRTGQEKKCSWHFHVWAADMRACVTGVRGDTEAEAATEALDWLFVEYYDARPEVGLEQFFGNKGLTYCHDVSCGGTCGLHVHVVRLQDLRLTKMGALRPVATVQMYAQAEGDD
jgi:hypothetical protein